MMKENVRNRVFPIKISKVESHYLNLESEKQNRSRADLIREGYLNKIKAIPTFSKLLV